MTPAQIAAQVLNSTDLQVERLLKEKDKHDLTTLLALAYLSGANQAASYLVRGDGLITPQLLEQGLKITGDELGFTLTPP